MSLVAWSLPRIARWPPPPRRWSLAPTPRDGTHPRSIIAETLYYQWRDRLLEGGKAALATPKDKTPTGEAVELREARKRIAHLERALGRKTYEVEVAGEHLRDWT